VSSEAIYTRPKSLPIAFDASRFMLRDSLLNIPQVGRVDVDRSQVGNGYSWSVTFLTQVGPQPDFVVNTLNLLGSDVSIAISTLREGVSPVDYAYKTVTSSESSVIFDGLTTGVVYYSRIVSIDDEGYNSDYSSVNSSTPAAVPLSSSLLSVQPYSNNALKFYYNQDAYSNGATIDSYAISLSGTGDGAGQTYDLGVSYAIQKVVTSAHTLPFTNGASFKLGMSDYVGGL
jgi:hypothetical protein